MYPATASGCNAIEVLAGSVDIKTLSPKTNSTIPPPKLLKRKKSMGKAGKEERAVLTFPLEYE